MQPPAPRKRIQAPTFVDRTPKEFEIILPSSSPSDPETIGTAGMAFGAGPLYTNALMGQAPSAAEREHARKASSTILREDFIQVEESENPSRPDSYSMHFDDTTQAPYSTAAESTMMTQGSILKLPKENASHDLAFFLRTTGPTAPHHRPSKVERPRRNVVSPRNALRLLKLKQKRAAQPVLRDEGGLLEDAEIRSVPAGVEQKVSSTGKRYLALQVPSILKDRLFDEDALTLSIMEFRVSITFADSINSRIAHENWVSQSNENRSVQRPATPHRRWNNQTSWDDEATGGAIDVSLIPVRPSASDPPTPEPASAVSMAESYQSDLTEHPAKRPFYPSRALSSHPVHAPTSFSLPLPEVSRLQDEFPQPQPICGNQLHIEHPSPRRFASQTALLRRASSMGPSLDRQSVSDSPGPPPRSPLRLRRDPRTIENIITSQSGDAITPRTAPSIMDVKEYNAMVQCIKPSVVTDCTGPIKRPRSRGTSSSGATAQPLSRKERGEQTRARKLRDRPVPIVPMSTPGPTIDAVVNAPIPPPRHRLKKSRPHILIPDLRPAPLATRASSSASSNASWKKITESTRTPVSAVPSEDTPISGGTKTGYTPISLTASSGSANAEAGMTFSPVMLVAEEIPIPKLKSTKVMVKESKPYAPRPRSASITRSAFKRRSRQGVQTPTRSNSPSKLPRREEAPPLPSPPPNRALPPTPPASGSEKTKKGKGAETVERMKDLPVLPTYEISVKGATPPDRHERTPHVATQAQQRSSSSKETMNTSHIHARLEALERHNALLSAALEAVIRTNGALNGPLHSLAEAETKSIPMSWETRIARRSAAGHVASSSNGSALDMYMRTRHGSKHAR